MKAIINGLRYDTETATHIGGASGGGYNMRDFHYWEEDLYKTPRAGRYFLAGKGGPLTRYAVAVGNNGHTGGERIIPLDADEAMRWAEEHLDADTIAEHFGDAVQDA
jgi:hypothetical protein